MPTCPKCNGEIDDDAEFCPQCGTGLNTASSPRADGVGTTQTTSETETDVVEPGETEGARFERHEKLVYGGVALTTLGAFLPWATVFGASVLGIEGDGIITLVLGLVAAGVVWRKPWTRTVQLATAGIGALILLIGVMALTNVAAIGLYLTLFGGLVITFAGLNAVVGVL